MFLGSRNRKRFFIGFLYLSFVGLLAFGVYWSFIRVPESCNDGIRNQDEAGIDCGGICTNVCEEKVTGVPFVLEEAALMPGGAGRYDVLGRVYNPNDTAGASSFTYAFEIKDASGAVIATETGASFILPQERKVLLGIGVAVSGQPSSVTLKISGIEWERFAGYQEKPNINIYQRRYNQISSGAGFSEAYGLVSNESDFDFKTITVKVILRDRNGKALAANMTSLNTVGAHEERDFRLVWPEAFPGDVETVDMEADADVYHSDNFTRTFLPGGKFQEIAPPSAY